MTNWILYTMDIRYQFRCSDEGKPDSRRKVARTSSFVRTLPNQVYEIDEKGKLVDQVMYIQKGITLGSMIILFSYKYVYFNIVV